MELTLSALNVRFGDIPQDDGSKMLWAKLTSLETDIQSRDGFGGIQSAEIRLSTENENKLAKQIHSDFISGAYPFPISIKLKVQTLVKKNEVTLLGIGYSINGNK